VVLDVACEVRNLGVISFFKELAPEILSRDVEDTMKSTKSAPVSHAHHNVLNASLSSRLD
jgi:hypothetical protein